MLPFLFDIIAQTLQLARIILAVNSFSFFQIVNENYPTRIPKKRRHDLAWRLQTLNIYIIDYILSNTVRSTTFGTTLVYPKYEANQEQTCAK